MCHRTEARWRLSIAGGLEPIWANGGQELFYRSTADSLVAAQVETTPTFSVVARRTLFYSPITLL